MPRFAANLTMLFNEVPFLERFALASEAGFEAVEYLFPYDYNAEELKRELSREQTLSRSCITSLPAIGGLANAASPYCLIASTNSGAVWRRRSIMRRRLAASRSTVLQGSPRTGWRTTSCAQPSFTICRLAAQELAKYDIRLLIEPINNYDIPGFYLNTVEQAASIIEEVGSDNLCIQYDLYHQQRTRGELVATYRAAPGAHCAHPAR